jgi:predicted nucleotidyltransferase/predicted transcriptional regulator
MNINELFSSRERERILRAIIFRTGPLSVGAISKELNVSKGMVSQYLDILRKDGILKRTKNKYKVLENTKTASVRLLFNIGDFDAGVFGNFKFVKRAGLYGSSIKGSNTESSDIDVWILVDGAREQELAKLTRTLKAMDERIRPLYLTKEKLEALKREEQTFYYSIYFGTIDIWGDTNEQI